MADVPFLDAPTPELRRWFEPPTFEAWTAEATRLSKGRPVAGLTRTLSEGVTVAPLHVAGEAGAEVPPGEGGRWWVGAPIDAGTPDDAARALGEALALGASARIVPDPDGRGVRPGVALPDAAALATALGGAGADDLGQVTLAVGAAPSTWAARRAEALALLGRTDGPTLAVDPLSDLVAGVVGAEAVEAAFEALADLLGTTSDVEIEVSGVPLAAAGADGVRELAGLLAALVETLRQLDAHGVDPQRLDAVRARITAGRDTFVELAKLRAARLLVDRMLARTAYAPWVRWEVVASPALLARHDPWTNLLRGTHAALVGALGGAAAIELPAWDRALGVPDATARRAAITAQLVLADEADLFEEGRVDAAAGAFLVERLTVDLARAAWEAFLGIERAGGLVAAVASGALGAAVDASRVAADAAIGRRQRGIVGVSTFPNADEVLPVRAPAASPAPWREAAGWEDLRDRASVAGVAAFLANLGGVDRHGVRKGFVRPLLDAAGVAVVDGPGSLDVDALVAGFRASGAAGAVICGDDADQAELVAPLARGLRAAGARFVLVAGRPGEHEAAWRAAGLSGALFLGGDVLATLRDAVQGVLR